MKKKYKMLKRADKNYVSTSSSIVDLRLDLIKSTDTKDYNSLKTLFSKDLSLERLATIIPIDSMQGKFTVEIEDEKIKESIDEWIKDSDIRDKIKEMLKMGFKYGDAGLLPVLKQKSNEPNKEFSLAEELGSVSTINGINNYSRKEISNLKREKDLFRGNYGLIKELTLSGENSSSVHCSRFFHFQFGKDRNELFGESIIGALKEQINVLKQTITSVGVNAYRGTILQLATTGSGLDGMKLKEKQTGIKPNDQIAGINTMVTGLDDKLTVHSASKFDAKNYYDTASQILCVAIGIPISRWQGTQQGKLTGSETDIKVYNTRLLEYRQIATEAYRFLVGIKLKELGKEKTKFDVVASDLNVLSEKEVEEIEKIKAESKKIKIETLTSLINSGVNVDLKYLTEDLGIPLISMEILKKKANNTEDLVLKKKKIDLDLEEDFFQNREEGMVQYLDDYSKEIKDHLEGAQTKLDLGGFISTSNILEDHFIISSKIGIADEDDIANMIANFVPSKAPNPYNMNFENTFSFFSGRKPALIDEFEEITDEIRANFSWIKKSTDKRVTEKLFKNLLISEKNGESFESWKARSSAVLEECGFGQDAWYLKNIYRTNNATAYNLGRYKQQINTKEMFPYLMYAIVNDKRTTKLCLSLDGVIYLAEDGIWKRIYPPNHFQ